MDDPTFSPEQIDPLWLIKAITRLETKMDAILHIEARVTALERYKSWLSGAVAMAGAFGAALGWYLANSIG
ncbi:MAG: hypothetical protein GWO27_21015 [Thermoplasmata archaeon]|nr:hypothetical protein [Thermoplasmata archaeon]NIT80163.1 hypothetical protein [Thermoplasmata archaeon]NIY06531.1 hypothetical protein [Thermoplasmata archaeon]